MADRYIAPSMIGPATDSRKPNAFEKVQMWWADGSSTRSRVLGTDGTVFAKSSYSDEDYLTDMQKSSSRAIDDINKAQAKKDKEKQERARLLYIEDQKKKTQEMNAIISNPNKTENDIERLKNLNANISVSWNDLDSNLKTGYIQGAATQTVSPTVAPQPGVPTPVRATEQPGTTPPLAGNQEIGGSNGVTPGTIEKNPANIYDKGTTQVYDATQIPAVLKGGKIQPAKYFAMNGLSWKRDAKRIAQEAGIQNYNGMPGQNYALVNYLEGKKTGGATPGTNPEDPNRKFDKIATDDRIPNRFTQEDRDQLLTMSPDEQNKYIQRRNLDDLKKMLPGNVGLINKVFGTNYTSDDLTGGIGRATIAGTGMTQAGMEVQRLIENLKPGQANKFMNKGMELDNSQADNVIISKGDQTVQMGRRKLLQDMVDNGQNSIPGTSIDANDLAYVEQYKDYKAQKLVADRYNDLVSKYNGLNPDNVLRNKALDSIRQYVDNIKATSPDVYKSLQADLDKFPQFANSGSKIPTIADQKLPGNETIEQGTKIVPGDSPSRTGLEIAPPKNNTVPPAATLPVTPETIQKKKPLYGEGSGNTTIHEGKYGELKMEQSSPSLGTKSSGGGYTRYENESRVGYSSNSISKG